MKIVSMDDKSQIILTAENAAEECQLRVIFKDSNDWRYEKEANPARITIYVAEL